MANVNNYHVWSKEMQMFWHLQEGIKKGGLTAEQRADVAREFSVSEDLLLRYERAAIAYDPSIQRKQRRLALWRAYGIVKKLGKDAVTDSHLYQAEVEKAYEKIHAEDPKSPIIHEYEAALAALRVAVNTPPKAPEK